MLIPIPDLRAARRILCVQPHYDDNDIGAGGTLATLRRAGAEVHYLTVADDLLGVLDPELDDAAARARLEAEQEEAGRIVGVAAHVRLGLPDAAEAGDWDARELRRAVARELRRLRPDFLVTVDPWLPHEAHPDHVRTGLAAAEAAMLFGLPRFRTDPEVDAAFRAGGAHALRGVALYFTAEPNVYFDIGPGREDKHRALDAYRSQLSPETLRVLHAGLEAKERAWGARAGCSFAEAWKVLHPAHLHCNPDAEEMAGAGG